MAPKSLDLKIEKKSKIGKWWRKLFWRHKRLPKEQEEKFTAHVDGLITTNNQIVTSKTEASENSKHSVTNSAKVTFEDPCEPMFKPKRQFTDEFFKEQDADLPERPVKTEDSDLPSVLCKGKVSENLKDFVSTSAEETYEDPHQLTFKHKRQLTHETFKGQDADLPEERVKTDDADLPSALCKGKVAENLKKFMSILAKDTEDPYQFTFKKKGQLVEDCLKRRNPDLTEELTNDSDIPSALCKGKVSENLKNFTCISAEDTLEECK
ncbi:uncharacterized protein LOC110829203 [Zootermopsis nevadensis]|uniref:Uncharacterized protein n=1 Tax=Zootermopsis nevadensis TaxID=136037 RepID=A0A067RL25_ZOONE|nr:uncharacterized protein LOC110829203 [Zootermopsis nevadensis]KDR20234.1 hypothetical protein L798_05543 [Zootermopsis nevadensis]